MTITFQPLNITLFTLRVQCLLNIRGRLRYIDIYNYRKLSIVYTKSTMFIKPSPTLRSPPPPILSWKWSQKECREIMTQFLDWYMQMSHSKLPFFGIIKLIVHVPRGRCLDRDFCCEIVPSLSLGHYLAQHQSLSRHSLFGENTLLVY